MLSPPRTLVNSKPGMASPGSPERANRFVLSYLEKRGYHRAAQALRAQDPSLEGIEPTKSAPASDLDVGVGMDQEIRSILQGLYSEARGGAVEDLEASYRVFSEWVSNSLDVYQGELQGLLYPILCHSYLHLLQKEPKIAHRFLKSYAPAFMPESAGELNALAAMTQGVQTQRNEVADNLMRNKSVVCLTSHVFHLALDFISTLTVVLAAPLLRIINEHCDLQIDSPLQDTELRDERVGGVEDSENHTYSQQFLWGELAYEAYMFNDDDNGKASDKRQEDSDHKEQAVEKKDASAEKGADGRTLAGRRWPGGGVLLEAPIPLKKHRVGEGLGITGAGLEPKEKMARMWDDDGMGVSVLCYTVGNTRGIGLNTAAVSKDATALAGGFGDSIVRVWDARIDVDSYPTRYIGHGSGVFSIGFSPCGKFLISGSSDGSARLWKRGENGKQACIVQYGAHSSALWAIEFAKFGNYFVSGGHDRTARVWSTEHIYPLRIFAGHLGDVDCVAWHPNCGYVATGSGDGSVRLWDIRDGNCIRLLSDRGRKDRLRVSSQMVGMASNMCVDDGVTAVAWETTGRRLAVGKGNTVQVWDVSLGRMEYEVKMPGGCWSLAWANEGGVGDNSSLEDEDRLNLAPKNSTSPPEKDAAKEKEGDNARKAEKAHASDPMEVEHPPAEKSNKEKSPTSSEKGRAKSKKESGDQPRERRGLLISASEPSGPDHRKGSIRSVLAAGGPDGVRCWNADNGDDMGTWRTRNTPIQLVQFNRKNLLIAVGAYGQR